VSFKLLAKQRLAYDILLTVHTDPYMRVSILGVKEREMRSLRSSTTTARIKQKPGYKSVVQRVRAYHITRAMGLEQYNKVFFILSI
jgi:hypothetical protein